jgi:hypothetical protein
MAEFRPGVVNQTKEPQINVDPGLKPGAYQFALVVVNERGDQSEPDMRVVTVTQR